MEALDLLIEAVKNGSESHVDVALRGVKDVNRPNSCDTYALHVAVWRNHAGIVARLLAAGANPDVQDGESGWSALHRALYWGNLRVASQLLTAGASVDVVDFKGRTPLDLMSKELRPYMQTVRSSSSSSSSSSPTGSSIAVGAGGTSPHSTWVYCWGSGANYQLGTGSTDFALNPVRVDVLTELDVVALAAAKYHSAAVGRDGRLWTWGWGRGGRLGHPDFQIHSGETALIHPWPVAGLGKRQVCSVAAGKHHMLVATAAGEVWSWGSGRYGKLGCGEVDTQSTPKRVAALQRVRVVQVAAAHKHSAALTSAGELYTWGANGEGQLGYGTSDSGCNPSPRLVDALKGKVLTTVSLAKRHTVVLTAEGEPYTWGHQVVTPRRVMLGAGRDISRAVGAEQVRFHRGHSDVVRPVAVAVAAGYTHTTCITASGSLLYWWSADPSLRVREVQGLLTGVKAKSVSASKTRTAVTTELGDLFIWEASVRESGAKTGAATQQKDTEGPSADAFTNASNRSGVELSGSYRGVDSGGGVLGGSLGATGGMALAGAALGRSKRPGAGGGADYPPVVPVRVSGVKRVDTVVVGEKHSMVLSSWSVPPLPDAHGLLPQPAQPAEHTPRAVNLGHDGDLTLDSTSSSGTTSPFSPSTPLGQRRQVSGSGAAGGMGQVGYGVGVGMASSWGLPMQPRSTGDSEEGHADRQIDSLQVIAQKVVARELVEPRTALPVLEYADAAGAALLRTFCLVSALRNMDIVLLEARDAFKMLPPHLLSELEQHYHAWLQPPNKHTHAHQPQQHQHYHHSSSHDLVSRTPPLGSSPISGSWIERAMQANLGTPSAGTSSTAPAELSSRRKQQLSKLQAPRRPTSVPSWLDGAAQDSHVGVDSGWLAHASHVALAAIGHAPPTSSPLGMQASASHRSAAFHPTGHESLMEAEEAAARLARNVSKKLQQIAVLEARSRDAAAGVPGAAPLDGQQLAKLSQKAALTEALHALEHGMPLESVNALLHHASTVAAKLAAVTAEGVSLQPAATSSQAAGGSQGGRQLQQSRPSPASGDTTGGSKKKASSKGQVAATTTTSETSKSVTQNSQEPAPGSQAQGIQSQSWPDSLSNSASAATSTPSSTNHPATPSQTLDAKPTPSKESKTTKRKGGLSMFLSGALDTPPAPAAPVSPAATPAAPKGPAWGGAGLVTPPAAAASLRGLLSQPEPRLVQGQPPASGAGKQQGAGLQSPVTPPPSGAARGSKGKDGAVSTPAVLSLAAPSPSSAQPRPQPSPAGQSSAPGNGIHLRQQVTAAGQSPAPSSSGLGGRSGRGDSTTPGSGRPGKRDGAADAPVASTPAAGGSAGVKLSLADFMAGKTKPSTPVPVQPPAETGPAWGGSVLGGSPIAASVLGGRSLKEIQAEQERQRANAPVWVNKDTSASSTSARQGSGAVPFTGRQTSTSSLADMASGAGSSSGLTVPFSTLAGSSPPSSKWYVPQAQVRPQALQHIQTEEAAMAAIAKLYGPGVSIARAAQKP